MIALDLLQRRICSAIRGCPEPALLDLVEGGQIGAAVRLGVYRNHTVLSLTQALKTTYPVVCRLVDERFFSFAAHEFIRDALPTQPCLSEYGERFPDFLAAFPPCRELVYLADVARLEWAINGALHAPNAESLDRSASDACNPLLSLHPSLRLVASPWPIDLIWRANQPEADPETVIDLDAGAARVQLHRKGDRVVINGIDEARFVFLAALAGGARLRPATEAAARLDRCFDAAAILDLLFTERLLVQPPSTAGGLRPIVKPDHRRKAQRCRR